MGYHVVLRRNGAKVGHFGPFTTKKQAIAQGQALADDAARDVVVSVEPQRKKATTKKKRTNTRRKNPKVPDVWGLPPKYGSKVVPPGDYKTLPLPARMGTHSTLYYEARSPQGGVANLTVEKKGRDRYFLSTDNQVRHEKGKEAREMIKHFLKSGRLPARSNPSRGTFKSKAYAYYTVAGGKLTSGHSTRKAALKQASGQKANVKTAKQAQKYLGKRADGSYRSLTSSASWRNQPRRNPQTRSNPASKSILKRIDLANKWIEFAKKHDIWGIDPYMSASSNGVIFYTHKITVSAQKNRATFKYTDGYGQFKKKESETYNLNNTDTYSDTGVSALRYAINSLIIKPIKRGAKDEGVTIPASLR